MMWLCALDLCSWRVELMLIRFCLSARVDGDVARVEVWAFGRRGQ